MKLGYPCINRNIGCTANSTFRLASYSEQRLQQTVRNNLLCLQKILHFNLQHRLLFFRISSALVPFASHPVCTFNWEAYFQKQLEEIGNFIKTHQIRISMHPDQFILINAESPSIIEKSIRELYYHCTLLDTMKLNPTAKVQIHVGGVYQNKKKSMDRFIEQFKKLPHKIRKRLVIENDDRSYSLKDCIKIHKETQIPIIFDNFHHECLNNGEPLKEAVFMAGKTWKKKDGCLMVDYSSPKTGARKGTHVDHIDLSKFRKFLEETKGLDFDIMLEIKDKETSALEAISLIEKKI